MAKRSIASPKKKGRPKGTRKGQGLTDAEAEKRHAKSLMKVLVMAERHGVIRWILKGAGAAFRSLQKQRTEPYGLPPEYLSPRRSLVAQYVFSLVGDLDALTLAEIINDLLFELRIRGTKDGIQRAVEAGIHRENDEFAPWATLLVMRMLIPLFCEVVADGDEPSASELPIFATEIVEALSDVARKRPQLVRGIAAEMISWPMMTTRHYPKTSDFAKLADEIGLAKKSPVTPKERQTWKPNTTVNRYLLDLIVKEGWGDQRPLTRETLPYYLDEILMPLFDKVALEVGGWEEYPEFSVIARGASKRGKAGVQRSEIRNRVARALKAFTN